MTHEEIIKLARKAGIAKHGLGWTCWEGQLERFAALVAAHEREACAKVLDDWKKHNWTFEDCAAVIRARGNK